MINLIFDIDGTLVESYALDTECFVDAVHEVLGDVVIRPDWNDYTDVTDQGILNEILSDNAIPSDPSDAVKAAFFARLTERLRTDPAACQEVPGAREVIRRLASTPEIRLGAATGGWAAAARAKLSHAGVPLPPEALFANEIAVERSAIMRACHDAIATQDAPTVYVGDGEWDMAATRELGWGFIGTGPRLKGRCDLWIADFTGNAFNACLRELSGSS